MTRYQYDAKAFAATSTSLQHALERCARHLQEAASLPDGAMLTGLLARVRDDLRAVREAMRERAALSQALHSAASFTPPYDELEPFEDSVGRLEALLEQLSPSREA